MLWLRSVNETRTADWFERYWCGPIKGRWLLANGGIAITGNNQDLESTWRWDHMANSQRYQVWGVCEKNGGVWGKNGGVWENFVLTSVWIEQTGLCLYIGNMLKSMKGASNALEARLQLEGHPNFSPSAPVVTTKKWDLLQTYNDRTLLCTEATRRTALQGSRGGRV